MAALTTLVESFENATKAYASRPLFGTKKNGQWDWMTYEAFGREVARVRGGFAKLGLSRGDAVAIISNNRVEWATAAYAGFGLAVAPVPMYEAQSQKDWEFIVRDSKAKVLVVATKGILEKAKTLLASIDTLKWIVCLEECETSSNVTTWSKLPEGQAASITPAPDDTACIIYTSGTTGTPKGVVLTHKNIVSNLNAVAKIIPIGAEDCALSFLPWAHVFGQTCELHVLISLGGSMALAESIDRIVDNLAEVRPTLICSVPRIFNRIYAGVEKQIGAKPAVIRSMVRAALRATKKIREGQKPTFGEGIALALADRLVFSKVRARFGGRLRFAFSGGAAISVEVAEFIDSLGITVYEGYGLTETSPIVTANSPSGRKMGSIGRAIPGVEVVIDSPEGRKTELGYVEGELVVFGDNVMTGYYNRPEESAAVFCSRDFKPWGNRGPAPERGFRTGDMGYVDREGFVFITGRIKEQYKLENGKYVVPTPLEDELKLSPFVLNVMVYGDNRPFNVAVVVANLQTIREWAAKEGIALPESDQKVLEAPRVREVIKSELARRGEKFKGFESVKDFVLVTDDFTTENGMLTPKMSLKRQVIVDKYKATLDALYTKKAAQRGASASA